MALKKLCSYRGCRCLVDYGIPYCSKHGLIAEQKKKDSYKDYKARRTDKKEQDFYNSIQWIMARELAKGKTNYIDVYEYYINGRIVTGDVVHHIVEVKEVWNKRLEVGNLIYLSDSSHAIVHAAYNKSDMDKIEMQKLLLRLLEKYKEEFGTDY